MAESNFWKSFLRPLCVEGGYDPQSDVGESESTLGEEDSEYQPSDGGSDPDPARLPRESYRLGTRQVAHYAAEDTSTQQQDDSPLEASASKWNVGYLNKYIKREQVDLVPHLCQSQSSNGVSPTDCQKDLINCSKQILDKDKQFLEDPKNGLKLQELPSWKINEATISILVQRVLGPVCQSVEVIMKPEYTLSRDNQFGSATVDFALFYEHFCRKFCVGVVEIKTPKTLGPDSVAQLVLPLMKLRDKNSAVVYLGILTDGFRYVFVKHQGGKFIFENTESSGGPPSIKIHELQKWNDLYRLQNDLCTILKDMLTH